MVCFSRVGGISLPSPTGKVPGIEIGKGISNETSMKSGCCEKLSG